MFWKRKKDTAPSAPARPLVVMVDDEPDLCTIMRMALEEAGYDFACAGDGEAGLELIRARRPGAVLLDIVMPRLNGFQVLARMQQDPALAAIPVIVLTCVNNGDPTSDEDWAGKLGICRFITKPVTPDVIVQAVREQLEKIEKDLKDAKDLKD